MYIKESRRDFRQRYRTCTVLVTQNNETDVFYVDDVDEDMEVITGSKIHAETNEWCPMSYDIDLIDINFNYPELGLLNVKKGVTRLTRFSTQQYRQSFNERTINITQINPDMCEIFKLPQLQFEDLKKPKFIREIFYPSFFSASGAINRIMGGDRYAGAISKDLFMTTSWISNGIYLGYKDVIVGKMRDNSMYPTVDLFNGNNDLIDLIQIQNIQIGGMLNVQR